ncbi:Spo0E family sporulation regulatory protein-aspartic acid phosphatase [Clostridium tetanomorphum]
MNNLTNTFEFKCNEISIKISLSTRIQCVREGYINAEKEMDYLKTLEISQYLDELIVEYMLKSL